MSNPTDPHLVKLAKRIAGLGIAATPLADLPALLGVGEDELAVDLAALIDAKLAVVWEESESGPALILSSLAVEDPSADPRALELARLVRQQRRDRLGAQQHSSKKEVLASDLGPRDEGRDLLNAKAADGAGGRDWTPPPHRDDLGATLYLIGLGPWEAHQEPAAHPQAWKARQEAARERGETVELPTACPVCKDVHAKAWDRYCLRCDASGKDGRVRFRWAPIDSVPRQGYKPDEKGLGGGVGKPAKGKKTKLAKPAKAQARRSGRTRRAAART
jgi:hypothetical protein